MLKYPTLTVSKIPTPILKSSADSLKNLHTENFSTKKSVSMLEIKIDKVKEFKQYAQAHRCLTEDLSLANFIDDESGNDSRDKFIAKLKILIAMLLNVWRLRKSDNRKLKEELDGANAKIVLLETNVQAIDTFMRQEQDRNEFIHKENKRYKLRIAELTKELEQSKADFLTDLKMERAKTISLNKTIRCVQEQLDSTTTANHTFEYQLEQERNKCLVFQKENLELQKQVIFSSCVMTDIAFKVWRPKVWRLHLNLQCRCVLLDVSSFIRSNIVTRRNARREMNSKSPGTLMFDY